MVSKKMVSLLLAAGLLMSGCGKKAEQTKKSKKTTQTKQSGTRQTTEDTEDITFSVPSASETQRLHVRDENVTTYERPDDFFSEYALEMIEEAKKQLPLAVQNITTYKVNVNKVLTNNTKYSTKEKYDVTVDKISCDVDSIKCMESFVEFKERWQDGDSGLVLHLCVRVHVVGTRTDTGEMVDDVFLSTFLVSRMGMTMTMDGSEILDGGKIKCHFDYLDTCFGSFHYYAFPDNITSLLDPDNLKYVFLWAADAGDWTSTEEQLQFRKDVFSEFDKHCTCEIRIKLDGYKWDGDTGLEDPYKADPSIGDGDDEPWPDE